MVTNNIANIYDKLYNSILNIKNNIQNGGTSIKSKNNRNIFNDIKNTYTSEFYDTNLQNFKDTITNKYVKDKIISCLRKHALDTDNINSLQNTICNNNIYNIIKNFYKLPNSINDTNELLFLITIAIYAIFSINFVIIILYIMKDVDKTILLILFLLLTFILFLILFLSL